MIARDRIPDWKTDAAGRLWKTFLFPDFAAALEFVNCLAGVAEAQARHPAEVHLAWGRVDVRVGVAEADVALAAAVDEAMTGMWATRAGARR